MSLSTKVLVTGANGYIAAWLCRLHLERGDTVIGTVRDVNKGVHLQTLFAPYGDKFKIAVVEDITKPGAFDEIVKGVDIVQHAASPVRFDATTADEVIGPAVHGTLGILESVKQFGTSVRRVVYLSSIVAVDNVGVIEGKNAAIDENHWNDDAPAEVAAKGDAAPAWVVYSASKTLAERAAWKFMQDNKSSVSFDLASLNPPCVYGPPIHEVKSLKALNASMMDMYQTFYEDKLDAAGLAAPPSWFIDVRDLAAALLRAAEVPEAGGERFIVHSDQLSWQNAVDFANRFDPTFKVKGNPGAAVGKIPPVKYDTSKAARILRIPKYRTLEDTVRDSLDYFRNFAAPADASA